MSQWTQERICNTCGKTFTLSEHGHSGAKALAEVLERLDRGEFKRQSEWTKASTAPDVDLFATDACPVCREGVEARILEEVLNSPAKKWWQFWR